MVANGGHYPLRQRGMVRFTADRRRLGFCWLGSASHLGLGRISNPPSNAQHHLVNIMLTLRLCQILFVFLIGVFAALAARNNLRDPQSNLRFVQHLLAMDTIFPDSMLKSRAIHSPRLQRLTLSLIILVEGLSALLCISGAALLAWNLGALPADFQATKSLAFAGLGLSFALWFGGFMVIGGQWFASWQSKEWSGRESAFMFYSAIGITFVILLAQS
jgi:predicted small integral membrane protein